MMKVHKQTKILQKVHDKAQNFALFVELMNKSRLIAGFLFAFIMGLFSTSCKKDDFFKGSTKLGISLDTLWFDTVFTRQPGSNYPISVTKIMYIKNVESQSIKVSLRLGGGRNSAFRFNVDGFAGPEVNDLEIRAKDSAFVFVQCTLEPNNQTKPALVLDSLITVVNSKEQKAILAAYGWDAHYIRSEVLPCGGQWTDKVKPYVIIDNALIEKGCIFSIREGVKVYNSARSILLVEGTLKIEGTASEPVEIRGDKPVFAAKYLPNQWGGIYLLRGSINNTINHAKIYNASIGVRVDSIPEAGTFNLEINQSEIKHCGQACMAGVNASVKATNCLFADAGSYSFLGLLGGNYDFRHCTFANYFSGAVRNTSAFTITNCIRDDFGNVLLDENLNCVVYNSVIYGAQESEYVEDKSAGAGFAVDLKNNLIKVKLPVSGTGIIYNEDPRFKNKNEYQFEPDTLSPVKDMGLVLNPPINVDLLNKFRDANPDLGCYERQD